MALFDMFSRQSTEDLVDREMSPESSIEDMESFMQIHTYRYGIDDWHRFEIRGYMDQSFLDEMLFDRQVCIMLRYDPASQTYDGRDVEIYYTFL